MTDTYLALISKHQKRTDVWNIVELFWTDFKRNKTIMSSSHFSCPSWAVISDWPFDRYTRYQLVIWFLYKNCNGTFWIFIASLSFHTRNTAIHLLNLRSAFFHFSLKIASNMSINKGQWNIIAADHLQNNLGVSQ